MRCRETGPVLSSETLVFDDMLVARFTGAVRRTPTALEQEHRMVRAEMLAIVERLDARANALLIAAA